MREAAIPIRKIRQHHCHFFVRLGNIDEERTSGAKAHVVFVAIIAADKSPAYLKRGYPHLPKSSSFSVSL
jgi:hypothetical protein